MYAIGQLPDAFNQVTRSAVDDALREIHGGSGPGLQTRHFPQFKAELLLLAQRPLLAPGSRRTPSLRSRGKVNNISRSPGAFPTS